MISGDRNHLRLPFPFEEDPAEQGPGGFGACGLIGSKFHRRFSLSCPGHFRHRRLLPRATCENQQAQHSGPQSDSDFHGASSFDLCKRATNIGSFIVGIECNGHLRLNSAACRAGSSDGCLASMNLGVCQYGRDPPCIRTSSVRLPTSAPGPSPRVRVASGLAQARHSGKNEKQCNHPTYGHSA